MRTIREVAEGAGEAAAAKVRKELQDFMRKLHPQALHAGGYGTTDDFPPDLAAALAAHVKRADRFAQAWEALAGKARQAWIELADDASPTTKATKAGRSVRTAEAIRSERIRLLVELVDVLDERDNFFLPVFHALDARRAKLATSADQAFAYVDKSMREAGVTPERLPMYGVNPEVAVGLHNQSVRRSAPVQEAQGELDHAQAGIEFWKGTFQPQPAGPGTDAAQAVTWLQAAMGSLLDV